MEHQTADKSDVLIKLFEEGKQFSMDLLKENEKLRLALAKLKTDSNLLKMSSNEEKLHQVESEKNQYKEELDQLRKTLLEIEDENSEFAENYIKVENQNQNMASLYVASYRLHSTLDFTEVIDIIEEIIINLIGSEKFGIFLKDERSNELCAIAGEGVEYRKIEPIKIGEGVAGQAAETGESYITDKISNNPSEPLACIPLKLKDDLIGMIVVYELLQQKDGFEVVDQELFALLADHAATAIYSSQLHTQSERKLNTLQNMLDLLRVDK